MNADAITYSAFFGTDSGKAMLFLNNSGAVQLALNMMTEYR